MSKKGFTIVELAIVLVVIGIILGMAVKGKALVDAARMRAEVTKINKFEAAAYTYYARTNALPPAGSLGNKIDNKTAFFDKELLTERDVRNEMTGAGYTWGFYRCALAADNRSYSGTSKLNSVCVASYSDKYTAAYFYGTNGRLVCNIENIKDDDNLTGGEGRWWKSTATDFTSEQYADCDTIPETTSTGYAFRVF